MDGIWVDMGKDFWPTVVFFAHPTGPSQTSRLSWAEIEVSG